MMAVAPLMTEHRLVDRMLGQIEKHVAKIQASNKLDLLFVDTAIDFILDYADKCHHGKEENILFKAFKAKPLTEEQVALVNQLISEHSYARKLAWDLSAAKERYNRGDAAWAIPEAVRVLKRVLEFYPNHVAREDKELFLPVMKHFSQEEQDALLAQFAEHDRKLIHDKYTKMLESLEERG